MSYLKAGFHMIADRRSQTNIAICDLRSAIIWKPALTFVQLHGPANQDVSSDSLTLLFFLSDCHNSPRCNELKKRKQFAPVREFEA